MALEHKFENAKLDDCFSFRPGPAGYEYSTLPCHRSANMQIISVKHDLCSIESGASVTELLWFLMNLISVLGTGLDVVSLQKPDAHALLFSGDQKNTQP